MKGSGLRCGGDKFGVCADTGRGAETKQSGKQDRCTHDHSGMPGVVPDLAWHTKLWLKRYKDRFELSPA